MQIEDEKRLDQWTKKVLKETQLDTPGSDFTEKIMKQITPAMNEVALSAYTPLISRKYWGLIAACAASLIVLAFFVKGENSLGLFQKATSWSTEFSNLDLVPASLFSENLTYGITALLFCLAVQVYLLKQWHTRSLSI